jgi:Response regulators consisting of a CheY-like receiver domain and a winged-helix DNA-binding domain
MSKKILIVDDEELIRKFLVRKLNKLGYKVFAACDGYEGVQLARENTPSVIIMDIAMPVMDGYDAIRELKDDEKTKHIPIIAVSAKAFEDEIKEGLRLGANIYLTKPIKFNELLSIVEEYVK